MVGKGIRQKDFTVLLLLSVVGLIAPLRLPHCFADTIAFYDIKGTKHCKFITELAVTEVEHAQGLMHRDFLPPDTGMLFIFDNEEIRHFWMRNTIISLDMIFIDSQWIVVDVHHGAKPMDDTTISSRFPAKYVLEINAGLISKCGIGSGMKVRFDSSAR